MGTVYLAEQREPIRRRVALKVVKLGMDTGQILVRFANERQALAMMDHPNIARIFDAGATPKGRPYFVMEYIEGVPITQYCDGKQMTVGQRLELFLTVCRAVQHAHQKGVIHRDLKPSNVLVMEQEGAPVPKVIDFGIAKATDRWAVEKTLLTQFGQMVGTPEYASPEQAEVMTGEVDETSDVYSLGVLLYELLIGTVPFDAARMRQGGLAEMLRIIREEEAPPLSRKLSAMSAAAADIAARRQTDPVSLRRLVDGDLNWITMKAVEKVRERRYASVAELAADIQRYIEHRPVLASPPSALYRARKFLRRHRVTAFGTAAGLTFVLLSGVTVWLLLRRDSPARPKLTEKDTIVLADFDNKTGDPVFDDTLRQGLSVELQQSPFLTLISDRKVQQELALMGQAKSARLTSEVAQQICERTASAAVLEGSITLVGSQYVLGLRARNCNTGNILDQQQAVAAKREDVLDSLSEIARKFRTSLGESLATVEKQSPLPEATTHSLEALKAFSMGMKASVSAGNEASIPFLERAVELDSKFAMAHAQLGLAYVAVGESRRAAESTMKGWQLRDRVSDRERFFIEFTYDRQVTGNLEKAFQTLELWMQTFPRRSEYPNPHDLLGGIATQGTGRFERAIATSQEAIAVDPGFVFGYANLATSYFLTGRFPEAERTLQRAAERKLEIPNFLVLRYKIAVLKGDQEQMNRIVGLARGKPRTEHWVSHAEALTLARSGRLQAAAQSSSRAVELAVQERRGREPAARYRAARAVWEAVCGNAADAKRSATAALDLSNGRDVQYAAGLALALSGGSSRSESLAVDLEKRFPEDTFVKFTYLPVLRALANLGRSGPANSVEQLQIAHRYELAANGLNFNHFVLGGLHSAYVRGQAFVAARRYAEAASEFQKILDHRGLVGLDPIGVLAHLQLGRVHALSGDKTKVKAAYEAFLTLWKDADPAIPILKSAKAEYARL
jgi:serine/threonine protein kinase/Tfp pilus assembly protein PilF